MDWKHLFRSWRHKKCVAQPSISGDSIYSRRMSGYREYVESGMCENVIVYRVISLIARNISCIPICVEKMGDVMSYERGDMRQSCSINALVKSRNANELLEQLVTHLLLFGNAYVHFGDDGMEALRPDRVNVISKDDQIVGYHYSHLREGDVKRAGVMLYNVVHLKFLHPLDDWYGLSPMQSAAMSIQQHNAVAKHNAAMLENGGRPSGCFILKNGFEMLTEEDRQKFLSDLRDSYQGARNAGRVMVLTGDMDWKEMGYAPKDLDFEGGRGVAAREIAMAYGVPPLLLGIDEHYSTAAYKEARYYFWEDTVIPLAEYIMNMINIGIHQYMNNAVCCSFNYESVPALRFLQESAWDRISSATFLSDEEKRILLGIDRQIDIAQHEQFISQKHSQQKCPMREV